jgi:hypothetical protein
MSTTEPSMTREQKGNPLADPMFGKLYMKVQAVLDKALGTEEEDGAGAGIEADVWLLAEQRDQAQARLAAAQAELEEAVRERTVAESKLARIATHCRQRLDMAIVQSSVSHLCREIQAIISDGKETGR